MGKNKFAPIYTKDRENGKWYEDVTTKTACEAARDKTGQTSDGGNWFKWNSSTEEC